MLNIKTFLAVVLLTFSASSNATLITSNKDASLVDDPIMGSTNLGSSDYIVYNWAGNLRSIGLVEFDLSSFQSNTVVMSATLNLYHIHNTANGINYSIFNVLSAWQENTVSFDNAPAVDGSAAATTQIQDSRFGVWRQWDITALVQAWIDGSAANFGLWIEETPVSGFGSAYFASSDNAGNFAPFLDIQVRQAPTPAPLALFLLGTLGVLVARKQK